jgi:hypothetical protein
LKYVRSNRRTRRTLRFLRRTSRKLIECTKGAIFLLFLPFF